MTTLLFTGGYDDCIIRWDISRESQLQRISYEQTMNKCLLHPTATILL